MVGQPAAGRLLPDEERERLIDQLTAALDRPVAGDNLFQVMVEQALPPTEWNFRRKDGSQVPVLLATSAMRDETGRTVGYLAVATDLTLLKQLEQKLRASEAAAREANIAKSAFLAAMSH